MGIMTNETLAVLENCKDFIETKQDDPLAKYLVKEIDNLIKTEIK